MHGPTAASAANTAVSLQLSEEKAELVEGGRRERQQLEGELQTAHAAVEAAQAEAVHAAELARSVAVVYNAAREEAGTWVRVSRVYCL